jgi:hypothetical protein
VSLSGVYQLFLGGLEGKSDPHSLHYISRGAAYEELKRLTGQDFGYQSDKWREFIRSHRECLRVGSFEQI